MVIDTVCADENLPARAHPFDAGADLKAGLTVEIGASATALVPTGVRVAIPEKHVGLLFARSSLSKRGLLMANGVGVIDSGYTGEVMVPLHNVNGRAEAVERGERIAQLVVLKCELPLFAQVERLPGTERGEGGFGSTGSGGEVQP